MFSLICAWINGWVNNGEADDLRRHRAHYDVTVMRQRHCHPNMVAIVHSFGVVGCRSMPRRQWTHCDDLLSIILSSTCMILYTVWLNLEAYISQWRLMSIMASQIAGKSIVCLTACYCQQRDIKDPLYQTFVTGIHQWPVMRRTLPCHDRERAICAPLVLNLSFFPLLKIEQSRRDSPYSSWNLT